MVHTQISPSHNALTHFKPHPHTAPQTTEPYSKDSASAAPSAPSAIAPQQHHPQHRDHFLQSTSATQKGHTQNIPSSQLPRALQNTPHRAPHHKTWSLTTQRQSLQRSQCRQRSPHSSTTFGTETVGCTTHQRHKRAHTQTSAPLNPFAHYKTHPSEHNKPRSLT
jgi:hypothetical protein